FQLQMRHFFFFQAEDGIRDRNVTGVQTCALPIFTDGMVYKGTLFEGVPNAAMIFGYTNSSWTLKSDLSSEYLCRLLNYMDKMGAVKAMPVNKDDSIIKQSFITDGAGCTNASYIQRALK